MMKNNSLKSFALSLSLFALPSFAATTPDGLITSKAKLALWTAAGVRSTTVHVDTNDGVVTLYGKVPTEAQKLNAEKAARDIAGVRSVKSLLQVVPESMEKRVERSDKDTKAAAEKLLKADPALKDSKIVVKSVDKGIVLLSGEARTFSDHLRAVTLVDRLAGVRGVASEVKGPDGLTTDERIVLADKPTTKAETRSSASDLRTSMAVKMRLLTAAEVPSNEIAVDTEDGVVTLFGIVPTADVSREAATAASKASGVLKVDNQLEVVATAQKKLVDAKDADITRDLALAFKDRADLKSVTTSVKNGTVQINGTVTSGWDEVSAIRCVRQVAGVRAVENQLKIDDKG